MTQPTSTPAVQKHRWTIEEVERLIDEREGRTPRYELVDGELLVTPAPSGRHQRMIGELHLALRAYVDRYGVGEVLLGPVAVRLAPPGYFEPDICVAPGVNGKRRRADDPVTELLLAVEVISPGSVRHDRITKRRFFQSHGVPDYWVVDGDAEAFEVWHPGDERAELLDEQLVWQPRGATEPFVLDVKQFFARVAD